MRVLSWLVFLVVGAPSAFAQPGMTLPSPYTYQPAQAQLSQDDQELLAQGEITDGRQIGGGVAALFVGFGVGQIVQGRWHDTGWIFTLGETVATVLLVVGVSEEFSCVGAPVQSACNNHNGDGLLVAGLLGYLGLHTWEVVDAFVAPPRHNAHLRALKTRLGYRPPIDDGSIAPYVAPVPSGGGGVAGLSLRF